MTRTKSSIHYINRIHKFMPGAKVTRMCCNCKHISMEKETITGWNGQAYILEKRLKCGIGGFKVGKSNWCRKHEMK